MKVEDIMNKAIVIEPDLTLKQASRIMSEKRIGSLIIIKGDKIIGIVTERDIIKNVDKINSKVLSIMSKNVISIEEAEGIDNAALLMSRHEIKRLPVVSKGKLVGIITATDILANSDSLNESFLLG